METSQARGGLLALDDFFHCVGWTYCFDFLGVHFGWTFMRVPPCAAGRGCAQYKPTILEAQP